MSIVQEPTVGWNGMHSVSWSSLLHEMVGDKVICSHSMPKEPIKLGYSLGEGSELLGHLGTIKTRENCNGKVTAFTCEGAQRWTQAPSTKIQRVPDSAHVEMADLSTCETIYVIRYQRPWEEVGLFFFFFFSTKDVICQSCGGKKNRSSVNQVLS